MSEKPKPIYITRKEGGELLPFPQNRGGEVHSIHFSDGSVFDAYNGWRPSLAHFGIKPIVRVAAPTSKWSSSEWSAAQ